jgi:hypothetical protein
MSDYGMRLWQNDQNAQARDFAARMAAGLLSGSHGMGAPQGGAMGMFPFGSGPMGQTGVTTVDDTLQQAVYTDIMSGAILTSGGLLLFGTGVVSGNFSVRYSQSEAGTTVKVPYFKVMPPMQTIASDGDEGIPVKLESEEEQNTVRHGYLGAIMTEMSQLFSPFGGLMPAEFRAQAAVRNAEWADGLLIDEAINKAIAAGTATNPQAKRYLSVYSATAPGVNFRRSTYLQGLRARGAMGFNEKPALLVVHTDVIADMAMVNDAIGNPNLVSGVGGQDMMQINASSASPTGLMLVPYMIPIAVTDLAQFKPAVTGGNLQKYRTLGLWPRALGWNQNPALRIETNRNIRIPSDEMAGHTYAVAHAFLRRDMSPLPGMFVWEHNVV